MRPMKRFLPLCFIIASATAQATIDSQDILGQAQADQPFSSQSGWTAQVIGQHIDAPMLPESGIHGDPLPSGETLRFGKVDDPVVPGRKALLFQLGPNDPKTSSSKRSEIAFRPTIKPGNTYWIAESVYVYDWGPLPAGDQSLFGTQVHSGADNRDLSPSFMLGTVDRNLFGVYARYSPSISPSQSNTVTRHYAETPMPFGRWVDFVFRFRQSRGDDGSLQAWVDGRQSVDYHGPLGFDTPGHDDYAKFGYYNWSAFNSSRKVLLRSPLLVLDATGSKYSQDDVRSFVRAH
jgi:hypothetical protein